MYQMSIGDRWKIDAFILAVAEKNKICSCKDGKFVLY